MFQEVEDWDSPKRSIRDSGYIDCWESERSDSLSPPRHTRDDSFDSLDSIGSRSRHTPSPDGLFARGSSDGEPTTHIHTHMQVHTLCVLESTLHLCIGYLAHVSSIESLKELSLEKEQAGKINCDRLCSFM